MLDRQTFVFSATLTVPDAVEKLKKGQAKALAEPTAPGATGKRRREEVEKIKTPPRGLEPRPSKGNTSARSQAVPFTAGSSSWTHGPDANRRRHVAESALECTEVRAARVVSLFFFPSRPRIRPRTPRRFARRRHGGDYDRASVLNYRVDICHTQTLRASYEPCRRRRFSRASEERGVVFEGGEGFVSFRSPPDERRKGPAGTSLSFVVFADAHSSPPS